MTPPPALNLAILFGALVCQVWSGCRAWRAGRLSWAVTWWLGAGLSLFWAGALTLRVAGAIDRSTYFRAVIPVTPAAFLVVWLLPPWLFGRRLSRHTAIVAAQVASLESDGTATDGDGG